MEPGKPLNLSTSYRPISLLSPVVKILERLVLPLICAAMPISRSQHGFGAGRSTTTALLALVTMGSIKINLLLELLSLLWTFPRRLMQ
jgi:hypothetical protein